MEDEMTGRVSLRKRCIVMGCVNHADEGKFVGHPVLSLPQVRDIGARYPLAGLPQCQAD